MPDPPAVFNVELTDAVVIELMRPYASVVITGIALALPVVTAPGPVAVKLTVVLAGALTDTVTLPAPELDKLVNTRLPLSYTEP